MDRCHRLALAGCGGMGRRHLRGYGVLEDFEPGRIEVAAVIDPGLARADFVAGEVEERFGARPQTFRSLEDAVSGYPDLSILDIVVAAGVHHTLATEAAEAGLHVMCEKPMAPTVAACRAMQEAANRHGTVLSIAENYRRDPISRLAAAQLALRSDTWRPHPRIRRPQCGHADVSGGTGETGLRSGPSARA